jgi:hypothetical protein
MLRFASRTASPSFRSVVQRHSWASCSQVALLVPKRRVQHQASESSDRRFSELSFSATLATLLGLTLTSVLFYNLTTSSTFSGSPSSHLYAHAGPQPSSDEEELPDRPDRPSTTHLSEQSRPWFEHWHSAAELDIDMFVEGVKSGSVAGVLESILYGSAGAFCPPMKDGSGVARADGAVIPMYVSSVASTVPY